MHDPVERIAPFFVNDIRCRILFCDHSIAVLIDQDPLPCDVIQRDFLFDLFAGGAEQGKEIGSRIGDQSERKHFAVGCDREKQKSDKREEC